MYLNNRSYGQFALLFIVEIKCVQEKNTLKGFRELHQDTYNGTRIKLTSGFPTATAETGGQESTHLKVLKEL